MSNKDCSVILQIQSDIDYPGVNALAASVTTLLLINMVAKAGEQAPKNTCSSNKAIPLDSQIS